MSFKVPCFCISVLRDFTKNALKKRFASLEAFLKGWKSAERKQAIIEEFENEGLSLDPLTEEVGKDLAMHIAFARPKYFNKTEIPQQVGADERRVQEAKAKESGKPPEIMAKMVEGAVNKFLNEQTLLGQPFVKDDKQAVEKILAARKAKVHGYAFLVVGEGIEKAQLTH